HFQLFNFLNNCGRGGRLTTNLDEEVTDSDPVQYAPTAFYNRVSPVNITPRPIRPRAGQGAGHWKRELGGWNSPSTGSIFSPFIIAREFHFVNCTLRQSALFYMELR